jgi:hypothetical protein
MTCYQQACQDCIVKGVAVKGVAACMTECFVPTDREYETDVNVNEYTDNYV